MIFFVFKKGKKMKDLETSFGNHFVSRHFTVKFSIIKTEDNYEFSY